MTVETKFLILLVFLLMLMSWYSWAGMPGKETEADLCETYARRMAESMCREKDDDCNVIVYLQTYFNCAKQLDN